ncbi:hypothetical protein BC829DRAFT_493471 [Chytridium lagenaria]|nr:hypothetical protein BC829DRAFT_493471 [Chytridium lagenaria]
MTKSLPLLHRQLRTPWKSAQSLSRTWLLPWFKRKTTVKPQALKYKGRMTMFCGVALDRLQTYAVQFKTELDSTKSKLDMEVRAHADTARDRDTFMQRSLDLKMKNKKFASEQTRLLLLVRETEESKARLLQELGIMQRERDTYKEVVSRMVGMVDRALDDPEVANVYRTLKDQGFATEKIAIIYEACKVVEQKIPIAGSEQGSNIVDSSGTPRLAPSSASMDPLKKSTSSNQHHSSEPVVILCTSEPVKASSSAVDAGNLVPSFPNSNAPASSQKPSPIAPAADPPFITDGSPSSDVAVENRTDTLATSTVCAPLNSPVFKVPAMSRTLRPSFRSTETTENAMGISETFNQSELNKHLSEAKEIPVFAPPPIITVVERPDESMDGEIKAVSTLALRPRSRWSPTEEDAQKSELPQTSIDDKNDLQDVNSDYWNSDAVLFKDIAHLRMVVPQDLIQQNFVWTRGTLAFVTDVEDKADGSLVFYKASDDQQLVMRLPWHGGHRLCAKGDRVEIDDDELKERHCFGMEDAAAADRLEEVVKTFERMYRK